MTLRLHHHPFSSNARRAVMAALHLGVKLDLVFVDLAKGAHRAPAFLALNPNGRVPVLEDDDFVLTESHAIMQYLADITPGQTVYPVATKVRADVNRWMFWNAQHFQPAVGVLNQERMVKPRFLGIPTDPVEVARGERLFSETASVLDAHLAGRTFVATDNLTLADLALGATLASAQTAELPLATYPNIQSWHARVRELPVWRETEIARG